MTVHATADAAHAAAAAYRPAWPDDVPTVVAVRGSWGVVVCGRWARTYTI